MDRNDYIYELEFLVRDYECDLLGIVNNANYLHYLEHARHEFLHAAGIDFAQLHDEGIDPVVVRMEVDYRYPLKTRDYFAVRIHVHREGRFKFVFYQDIYRLPDDKPILQAKVIAACLQNGRPVAPDKLLESLENYISK